MLASASRRVARTTAARLLSTYESVFSASISDPSRFWHDAAMQLPWMKAPTVGLVADDAAAGRFSWFTDGIINAADVCVDQHARARPDDIALVFESAVSSHPSRTYTWLQLQAKVNELAAALQDMGIGRNDTVVIYMPMLPETAFAQLACAKLGAVFSVVFGGFAPHELAVRIEDCRAKAVLTAACGVEGPGKVVEYKPLLDQALELSSHRPEAVLLLRRPESDAEARAPNEHDWERAVDAREGAVVAPEPLPSTHPLYNLYTSGSTGQPKGVVRGTGDYLTALNWSMDAVYNVRPGDTWWAASDFGWVVGHSYILWGPMARGVTSVIFEGKPVGTPDAGTFWRVIAKHNVRRMFTAPTAIRAIKKEDPKGLLVPSRDDGFSLETLFLAGERSDPETIGWAGRLLGVPVIDHYWQTESGWPIVANCIGLGALPVKPGSSTKPVPGWDVRVLKPQATEEADDGFFGSEASAHTTRGKAPDDAPALAAHASLSPHPLLPEAEDGELGPLVFRLPLPPGALMTLLDDPARMHASYLSRYPGYFEAGDAAIRDEDGYIHIMARTDDVLNVAGHRLSTGAIEEAIAKLDAVAESAVIGPADPIKGQLPVALVVLKSGRGESAQTIAQQVAAVVRSEVGPVAALRVEQVAVVDRLPKTRSGKVLRATMKAIADGAPHKTPATIDDPAILGEVEAALRSIGYAAQGR